MHPSRNSRALIRWSGVLAAGGVLILGAALCLLAMTLWHAPPVGGRGRTSELVPPALIACFVVASIVVAVASAFARHIANHRLVSRAKRLSLIAMIGTAAGWLAVGVAVLLLRRR